MRNKGTFEFSGNLEVRKDGPLEAKSLATNYTDLVKEENWTDSDGVVWVYPGLNVTCKDRPGKIYQLASDDYTNEDNWIPIGDTSEISSKLQDFINSKGSANGIASLDEQGVVPSSYFLLSSSANRIISTPLSSTAVTAWLNASPSGRASPRSNP